MKILHAIQSTNPVGGGPIEGVRQLAAAQSRLGCYSEVVSLDPPDAPWLADFPLPHYPMGPVGGRYSWSPRLIPWLKAHHRDYDVVVVNGLWQFHGLAVRTALYGSGTPYCVFPHGMLDPWFKRRYPLKHLKKWLYWPWAEYRILRDAAAVLFTTEEERLLARQSFWLYRCREAVVHHGTEGPTGDATLQRSIFFQAFPALAGKRLLLFLGRIHEKKGCDLLVEAFHRFAGSAANAGQGGGGTHPLHSAPAQRNPHEPPFHLVLAGPGETEYGARVRDIARRLGIEERIEWTGMLTGDLKWGAFHAAEAFVLPSHQENFGISVAESLACGTPVLISNKVNIWREIEEDEAGLVETDDLAGTVRLLERWGRLDERQRTAMRRAARTCFEKRFEIGRAAEKLRDTLAAVVRKR